MGQEKALLYPFNIHKPESIRMCGNHTGIALLLPMLTTAPRRLRTGPAPGRPVILLLIRLFTRFQRIPRTGFSRSAFAF